MKTRIRTREYNNGKVEYFCEKNISKEVLIEILMMSRVNSAFVILSPLIYFLGNWRIIERRMPLGTDIEGELSTYPKKGVFRNIEEAKGFIDDYLKEEQAKQALAHGKKIKKETFKKYP